MLTLNLMRHVDPGKYQLHFCALSGRGGELDEEIRGLGGEVFPLRLGSGFVGRFGDLLDRHRYDVVHSHVHMSSGLILFLAARKGVPGRVAHFHSVLNGRQTVRKKIQNAVMRLLIERFSTQVIAVCDGVMSALWAERGSVDPRYEVIYNGIPIPESAAGVDPAVVRRRLDLPPGARVYIHVGRMAPPKNHRRLIEIFRKVLERHPDSILLLVGRGGNDIEREIRARVEECGLAPNIRFLGERPDVPELLPGAELMLFPSLWEGLPMAVLESCLAGTPVLASDLPGIREVSSRLPALVTCLPENAADDTWAEFALRPHPRDIGSPVSLFRSSPFSMENFAASICRVWESQPKALGVHPQT